MIIKAKEYSCENRGINTRKYYCNIKINFEKLCFSKKYVEMFYWNSN